MGGPSGGSGLRRCPLRRSWLIIHCTMYLLSGTRLGPYKIEAPIGAGGMGEVYRATDTRLKRDVAVKILLSSLSAEPGAKQRFEREAHTASALRV